MVDVSACKGLVSLKISGQGLEEVLAKTCPRLQEVALASRNLRILDVSHCTQLRTLQLPALLEARPVAEAPAAQGPVVAAAESLSSVSGGHVASMPPKLMTMYSEGNLPEDTVLQIRAIKARRRALLAANEEALKPPN